MQFCFIIPRKTSLLLYILYLLAILSCFGSSVKEQLAFFPSFLAFIFYLQNTSNGANISFYTKLDMYIYYLVAVPVTSAAKKLYFLLSF